MADITRTETIDITNDDADAPDPFESTTEAIFRSALEDFKSDHPAQCESFPGKSITHVKCKIMSIQHRQERMKAMMNFSRIQFYLDRFSEFDSVCKSTRVAGEDLDELSAFIWGPSTYILQVSQEDHTVLDVVLDAYQRFGRRIPDIQIYNDLIKERPNMMKCVAFMYHDLLQFYRTLIRLLTGRGWKKRFQANWRDYEQSFDVLLQSFDAHGKVLKNLLEAWQKQASNDANQRANDHMMRSQDSHALTQMQIDQNRQLLEQTGQVVNDIHQQLGDHAMRSQDQHSSVQMRLSQSTENQEALIRATQDIAQRLDDYSLRAMDNHVELQRHMSTYEQDRMEMLRIAKEQERQRREDKRRDVLTWMSVPGAPSQSVYHSQFQKVREDFPETGTWILNEDKIFNWMHAETPTKSMLWLNGKKGAGKTVLASLIAQKCMEIEGFKTSYFYCHEDDANQNTFISILKGLLGQMVTYNEDMIPSCHEKRMRGEERLNDPAVIKSLMDLFCDYEMNQFIIIDGLDECKPAEIKPLVQYWASVVDKCDNYKPGKIRVLLLSQDIGEIRRLPSMQSADIFALHPDQSDRDIRIFVKKQFDKLQQKFELSEDETRLSRGIVCSRAEGMFLYAVLTTENLLAQLTTGDVKAEIKADVLPETLEMAYKKIIERLRNTLGQRPWEKAKKIFGWLAGAKRPLQMHELQAALSIQPYAQPDKGEDLINYHDNQLRTDIREICGSLVQVLEDRIEFIHSTTKSHIIKSEYLDERLIEFDLTHLCLKYLAFPCFDRHLNEDDIKHYARDGWYALQDYAISKWKHHLENFIRIALPLFLKPETGAESTREFGEALAGFLKFHQQSIIDAAQEKRQTGSRRQVIPVHPVALAQAGQPLLSPPASQPSSAGSRSPTPLSSTPQQQQQHAPQQSGIDPALFCQPFRDISFYQDLVSLWTHICKHQTSDFKERNKVSLPHLGTILEKIRTVLEELSTESRASSENGMSLRKFYGTRFYKCQRVTCDYFHEGFDTKAAQDKHSDRHDRPFQCPVQNCTIVLFGFSSNKDRDKHIRQYHPDDDAAGPSQFVASTEGKKTVAVAKWGCDLCGKKFTRQAILKAHLDSHYGTRSHACETCGKLFTRSNDRNRHRKIHTRRVMPGRG